MTSKLRLLPLLALAIAALGLAACGGSSASEPTPAPSPAVAATVDPNEALFVSNGTEVLGRSGTAFSSTDVKSFTGDAHFSFTVGTFAVKQNSQFASEAPDKMYVQQTFEGGDTKNIVGLSDDGTSEMLARDGNFYMNLGKWISFTPEDLGATPEAMQKMIDWGTLFDYTGFLTKRSEDVRFIANEDVNGHATARYKFEGTLKDLFASFSEAFGGVGDYGITQHFIDTGVDGPVTIDLWVGKDDFLPYKLAMTATGNTPYGHMSATADAGFDNYNQPAPIPDAPKDAIPYADYIKDMFTDDSATATPGS